MKSNTTLIVAYFFYCTAALAQFTLTSFSPSSYTGGDTASLAAMRTSLGIDSLIIEDFTSIALASGRLQISGAIDIVTENGNSGFLRVSPSSAPMTITIQGGTSRLGIGLSAFESSTGGSLTTLSINGGTPIDLNTNSLPNFNLRWQIRNGYLIIDAPIQGPLIQYVEFRNVSGDDGFQLDYLAYGEGEPVPANPSIKRTNQSIGEVGILFEFQSALETTYTIQESLNLDTWTDAITGVIGDGKVMQFSFELTEAKKFYRLKH